VDLCSALRENTSFALNALARVKVRVIGHLYSTLLWAEPIAKDMARDSKGITQ